MRRKILVLVVTVLMVLGSALPALAQPVDPDCGWDWDRYLWRAYEYELWYYGCELVRMADGTSTRSGTPTMDTGTPKVNNLFI